MKKTIGIIISIFAMLGLVLAGCTAPGSSTTATNVASTGKIEIRVTDAPPDKTVTGIMVTVDSVKIHQATAVADGEQETEQEQEQESGNGNSQNQNQNQNQNETTATETTATETTTTEAADDSGWITLDILEGAETFDLLQIQGLEEILAVGELAAGKYTQIRMAVSKVEVTFEGEDPVEAKLPSGNLKFVHPFDIVAGETTVLLFDFDALKSVNVTGNGVIFKPVIKLSVTKTPGTLEITTESLPNGTVDTAYEAAFAAMGGKLPYTWSTADTIPGLALSADGVLSGTPTEAGEYTLNVIVEDSSAAGKSAAASFVINIADEDALQITTTNLPEGAVGTEYTATLEATGGTGAYTWSIPVDNLPEGLTLDSATGIISGTPTVTGDTEIGVVVTDSADPANTDTQNLTLNIAEAITT
ncbi:MAG: DUF4382 domain-containing protein [Dehalococcoidales bacterium]|nr:DUF4382 domain-containing protein [Dehalococcoidales bacterium]